jgi:iron only hydrogenase large subunit-like protein
MACPSGCLNGGGQIKSTKDAAEHLQNVSRHNDDLSVRHLHQTSFTALIDQVSALYAGWEVCSFHPIDASDPMH